MMEWIVEVVHIETEAVERSFGPMPERRAEKLAGGLLAKISDEYYIEMTPTPTAQEVK